MLSPSEQEPQKGIVATVAGVGGNILQIAFNGASICIKLVGDAAIYMICTNPAIAVASCAAICNLAGLPIPPTGIIQLNDATRAVEKSVKTAIKDHTIASTAAAIGIAAATVTPEIKSTCESIFSILKSCISSAKHLISCGDHLQTPVEGKFSEEEFGSMVVIKPTSQSDLVIDTNSVVLVDDVDGVDMFRSIVLDQNPVLSSHISSFLSSIDTASQVETLEKMGLSFFEDTDIPKAHSSTQTDFSSLQEPEIMPKYFASTLGQQLESHEHLSGVLPL